MKTAANAMKYERQSIRYRTKDTRLVEKNIFEPLTTWSLIAGGSKELTLRSLKVCKRNMWVVGFWIELIIIVILVVR